jgi:hypothetical protein
LLIFPREALSPCELLWSHVFGGPESDIPRAVAVDTAGNILAVTIAGSYQAQFGPSFSVLPRAGGWDMFLVHLP